MKRCSKCGVEKDVAEFKGRAQCKECRAAYNKQYRQEHREQRAACKRNRKATDPLFKLKCNISSRIYNSLKARGYSKTSKTASLLGCSFETLMEHLGPKPTEDCHLDHICPCNQAQTEEELLKLQHYTNLRWLPAEENKIKSDKWTPEGEEMCRKLLGRDWVPRLHLW